jgi:hypothetical protein
MANIGQKEFLGWCLPAVWEPEQLCLNPADASCIALVRNVTDTSLYWVVILTSAGGGGHWSAAKNLATLQKTQWSQLMTAASVNLHAGAALLTPFGKTTLENALERLGSKDPPIELVDIMNSEATHLLGEMGVPMGKWMAGRWDKAQKNGDIPKLKHIFNMGLGHFDGLFYHPALQYINQVLRGMADQPHISPPAHLLATEPLLTPSITKAVESIEEAGGDLSKVHLYVTDLPSIGNGIPFSFENIALMVKKHPDRAKHLVLHSVAPISGGAEAIAQSCQLDVSQVVIEPFLPVNPGFYDGTMPRPHTATQITLKAQVPEEEAFLGGATKTFSIGANDIVVLVMLGSQPTIQAMHTYLKQAGSLPQPPAGATTYVFFASGPHKKDAFKELYASLAKEATQMNTAQQTSGQHLYFVPFTGQPAQSIEARAEVTVTRSGGMTAGELLALHARGDNKQTLIHIEPVPGLAAMPTDPSAKQAWEAEALDQGMLTWEADNARYLMAKVGAKLITPDFFASSVTY